MNTDNPRWFEHRMNIDTRPRIVYEYYVTGRGYFPFDMLRYDAAWPVDGEAAAAMEYIMAEARRLRSIKLRSHRAPTLGRWESFGWSVGRHNLTEKRR